MVADLLLQRAVLVMCAVLAGTSAVFDTRALVMLLRALVWREWAWAAGRLFWLSVFCGVLAFASFGVVTTVDAFSVR